MLKISRDKSYEEFQIIMAAWTSTLIVLKRKYTLIITLRNLRMNELFKLAVWRFND